MAKDIIHNAVKNALIKDGWTITADPFRIEYAEFTLFADLAMERWLDHQQRVQRVVIEIKSFIGRSFVEELQKALGQYLMYQDLLAATSLKYEVSLAVSKAAYDRFFEQKAVQAIIQAHRLTLLVVDTEREEVDKWIS